MRKLTKRQKANIIKEYAVGGISQRELGRKYGVSQRTISKITTGNEEFAEKVREEKAKTVQTMQQWFIDRTEKAQSLLDCLLDIPPEEIRAASLRDKMGAVKILKEAFTVDDRGERAKSSLDTICEKLEAVTRGNGNDQ